MQKLSVSFYTIRHHPWTLYIPMQYFVIESKKIKPIISAHSVGSCAGQVLCGHTKLKLSHLLAAREGLKEDRIWRMGSEDTGKKPRYPPHRCRDWFLSSQISPRRRFHIRRCFFIFFPLSSINNLPHQQIAYMAVQLIAIQTTIVSALGVPL
jgi:hypothetical protein